MSTEPSKDTQPSGNRASRAPWAALRLAALVLCVAVAGASVMIYEFLAVRILTRYVGGSLDAWASVITVLLAGLSLGYALGGLAADKYPSWKLLGLCLLLAGFSGLFMERITVAAGEYLLNVTKAVTWHPYFTAALSSFLPVLALGAVLPQAIRLHARRIEHVGTTAGWITAVSTFGSIVGVLLAARVLIPYVGVREALYATSIFLMVFGGVLLLFGARRGVVALLVGMYFCTPAAAEVIFENYSAYHHILVEDQGQSRLLRFDRTVQSTMSLRDPSSGAFEYTDFFHVPMVFDPTIRSVLFIGLGGGSGPKAFLRDYPYAKIDVVEIDPMVVRVARKYFAVRTHPNLRIITQDGRTYLQRSPRIYGTIIVDAYGSGPYGAFLPYHLSTQEFLKLAWRRLMNGGSVVYNVMGVYRGLNDDVVRGIQVTLESVFQAVYAFRAKTTLNTVFVAVKIDSSTLRPDGTRSGVGWPGDPWLEHPMDPAQLADLAQTLMAQGLIRLGKLDRRVTQFSRVQRAARTSRILTDNYAPVDLTRRRQRRR